MWAPSPEQVEAARNQGRFYAEVWTADFDHWYSYFRDNPNATDAATIDRMYEVALNQLNETSPLLGEDDAAFGKALFKASGRSQCFHNSAGTSWFYFTVMTTVGRLPRSIQWTLLGFSSRATQRKCSQFAECPALVSYQSPCIAICCRVWKSIPRNTGGTDLGGDFWFLKHPPLRRNPRQ
jgi:hypothetical protein